MWPDERNAGGWPPGPPPYRRWGWRRRGWWRYRHYRYARGPRDLLGLVLVLAVVAAVALLWRQPQPSFIQRASAVRQEQLLGPFGLGGGVLVLLLWAQFLSYALRRVLHAVAALLLLVLLVRFWPLFLYLFGQVLP
jgi:sterol desaturase/sphingolipid hydroxylase (fatty acid hydroxylase superfamily)